MVRFAPRVEFPGMSAHAKLSVAGDAAPAEFELLGKGTMAFSLVPTAEENMFTVQVEELILHVTETRLEHRGRQASLPAFRVDTCDLDRGRTRGRWDSDSRRVELHIALVLDPRKFPFVADFGIREPMVLELDETGTLDFGEERHLLDTHARPFVLPAPLDAITVSPGQFCDVDAQFFVSLQCGAGFDYRATEIWICPGEEACLEWTTKNASEVEIDPDGPVGDSGTMVVRPMSTTTYQLRAGGNDCNVKKKVTVRVVGPGENTYNLEASWNPFAQCTWRLELPQALYGPSVMVQEMQHVPCEVNGQIQWPKWAVRHTTPNGATFNFNIGTQWRDITDQQLAGVWEFTPLDVPTCRPPEGQSWAPACFEARIGCRRQ